MAMRANAATISSENDFCHSKPQYPVLSMSSEFCSSSPLENYQNAKSIPASTRAQPEMILT